MNGGLVKFLAVLFIGISPLLLRGGDGRIPERENAKDSIRDHFSFSGMVGPFLGRGGSLYGVGQGASLKWGHSLSDHIWGTVDFGFLYFKVPGERRGSNLWSAAAGITCYPWKTPYGVKTSAGIGYYGAPYRGEWSSFVGGSLGAGYQTEFGFGFGFHYRHIVNPFSNNLQLVSIRFSYRFPFGG